MLFCVCVAVLFVFVVVVVSLFYFSALLVGCFAVTNVTFASLYVGFRLPLCRYVICIMFLFNKIFVNYQKKKKKSPKATFNRVHKKKSPKDT